MAAAKQIKSGVGDEGKEETEVRPRRALSMFRRSFYVIQMLRHSTDDL